MTRGDFLVTGAAAALVAGLYLALWDGGAPGARARVTVSGEAPRTVALDRDRRLTLDGPLGPTTLEVRDGRIRFTASPCRKKVCVRAGWLARAGEFAACLPNGVSVQVLGAARRFDAINY
ncbi:MAG: NusG domain II-containing protein [Gammaproteobacteria bacterium]|nr:NusG domain II-containing protein [Gammaproteobacteria bacterium]